MYPELFEIPSPWGGVPVYSYGVMLGFSLIFAWYLIMALGSRREELSREVMANAFIVTAVVAIACARLLYIATNPDEFTSLLMWFQLSQGGLVAYGGFLGGLLGSWAYLRRKNASLLGWADVVAPTLGSGLFFTRIGCYLFGCDFGARFEAGAPEWLMKIGRFPRHSPAWVRHIEAYDLDPTADLSLAVHPTQLYESLAGLALFVVSMLVWRKRHFRGQVILIVTALYGIWRFLIEYVRDDPERGFYFGFSTSQLISIALVPFAAFLYQWLRKQQGPTPIAITPAGSDEEAAKPAADAAPEASDPAKARKKRRKKR